ncbi:hypothetical protein EDD86DRAFT_224940 [Gorgonomyces haynaldii]|nr:hypothetical protein EDD86DRAFT_224940 [Gorgonomyces haynaldii]
MSRKQSTIGRASKLSSSQQPPVGEIVKVPQISKWSWYEYIIYKCDVLVPEDTESELLVPPEHHLQKVHIGPKSRWRVVRDPNANLPAYLVQDIPQKTEYTVRDLSQSFFKALDPTSPFLRKWDTLALCLLFFTASVTPFETAFLSSDSNSSTINIDLLFILNRIVDVVFFCDIFIQIRLPYRDDSTGKLVVSVKKISYKYFTSWFFLDIISVLPFEFLGHILSAGSGALQNLSLLRFFRLTRLLKLLRVFRASRKLKKLQVTSGLRYSTLEMLKIFVMVLFLTHWMACGYRLAAETSSPTDPHGWVYYFEKALENTTVSITYETYMAALYYSASIVTIVGPSYPDIAPTNDREFIFTFLATYVAYFLMLYAITSISQIFMLTNDRKRRQDVLLDEYLSLLEDINLQGSLIAPLKISVYEFLTSKFTSEFNEQRTRLLRELPASVHGFIAKESFLDFVEDIPWLKDWLDREPNFIQEICRKIQIVSVQQNALVFQHGCDGVYFLEKGLCAVEGTIYVGGNIFGRTVLRDTPKDNECRALTDCKLFVLKKGDILELMKEKPKIHYYAKRWTQWQLTRQYILEYTKLYFIAARRGAVANPPLISNRPNAISDEDYDDIDYAVMDHIRVNGY